MVSPNGQTVVAGNGVILDAQTLTDQGTLDPFSLGSWLPSGELVTLIQEDNPRDIRYLLKRKSSDLLSTLEETHIDGRVLSVHWTGESLLIIKLESGYPAFETYAPNTDSDSDDFKNN